MTTVQAVETLLDAEWVETVSGRPLDVPKPEFLVEKDEIKETLRTNDVARVTDGGDEEHTPLGFGWTHERIDEIVTIELRTADRIDEGTTVDGLHRLVGERGGGSLGPNEGGRWPGLVGETKRVLLANRKGFGEYSLVGDDLRVQKQFDLGGAKYYRADVVVPLTQRASSIDTST